MTWRSRPEQAFDAGSVCMALDLRAPVEDARVLAAAADSRRSAYAAAS